MARLQTQYNGLSWKVVIGLAMVLAGSAFYSIAVLRKPVSLPGFMLVHRKFGHSGRHNPDHVPYAATGYTAGHAARCWQLTGADGARLKLLRASPYFNYVIDSLHAVLSDLGIPHDVVDHATPNDTANVYLTCQANEPTFYIGDRFIVYNFEQLQAVPVKEWRGSWDQFQARLRAAEKIFDYSQLNIQYLRDAMGLHAAHLPFGYMPMVSGQPEMTTRDINTVFLGLHNDKRKPWLKAITDIPHASSALVTVEKDCQGDSWLFTGPCW